MSPARTVQVTVDCAGPAALCAFWVEALGYVRAVDQEMLANASAIRRAWLTDPALRGLPAPFPIFEFPPSGPDDLLGIDGLP